MRTYTFFMLFVLLFSQIASSELTVDVAKIQVMTGLVNPKLVDNLLLYDSESSSVKVSSAAYIKVTSDYKFTRVRARQTLFESGQISKLSDTEYLLVGSGKFAIEVIAFDPEKGIDEKLVPVDLEDFPSPEPDPGPQPTPSPIPDDEFNNLGKRVFSLAKDLPKRKELAKLYEEAAKTLTDDPKSTINSVASVLVDKRIQLLDRDATTYSSLIDFLNNETKSRWPMTRTQFSKFLQVIALALKA